MSDAAVHSNRTDARVSGGIDRTVPIPYYYQLEGLLREEIESGHYASGQRVPSEKDLCKQYGVSRTTVRQAIGKLEREGLLHHRKGKGTFVGKGQPP